MSKRADYDLEERTAVFGEAVIDFCKQVTITPITRSLVDQLVRSGTSVGANYCEADDSHTKKEFLLKIGYCRKEARESKHWLRMMARAVPEKRDAALSLWKEAKELHLIFVSISKSGRS